MRRGRRPAFLPASALARVAVWSSLLTIGATALFLVVRYPHLPELLPVHFRWDGRPNGWQFRTVPRVLMPVFVQLGLLATLGGVSALLRSRHDAAHAAAVGASDARAATTAAETVMGIAAIWIVFQGYAAVSLVALWQRGGATLGVGYSVAEFVCGSLTLAVAARAQWRLGRPAARPDDPSHWRWRQLYCNADDPALFVPTRDGGRWTLNFGRRAAVWLLAGVLVLGAAVPTVILALSLR